MRSFKVVMIIILIPIGQKSAPAHFTAAISRCPTCTYLRKCVLSVCTLPMEEVKLASRKLGESFIHADKHS